MFVQLLDVLLTSLALRQSLVLNADWLPVVLGDDKIIGSGVCELGMAPSLRAFAESYNCPLPTTCRSGQATQLRVVLASVLQLPMTVESGVV